MELPVWVKELVSMLIRHGAGYFGGMFAAWGFTVTDSMIEKAIALTLGGIALGWSWYRKRKAREATLA